jgi:hypothetical protein
MTDMPDMTDMTDMTNMTNMTYMAYMAYTVYYIAFSYKYSRKAKEFEDKLVLIVTSIQTLLVSIHI